MGEFGAGRAEALAECGSEGADEAEGDVAAGAGDGDDGVAGDGAEVMMIERPVHHHERGGRRGRESGERRNTRAS